jgi:AcrR family transcriptional regulator
MTTDDPAAAAPAEDGLSWRELAVARSLDSARTRAESRVQRFMDAALELVNSGLGKDFTVQEVVERSGQSLRSFYQYFEGKHELLLALFEESVNSTAEYLEQRLEDVKDPLERLHCFVVEYHELCRPEQTTNRDHTLALPVMAEFAWQLLTEHPQQAARAFIPLVTMYEELLDKAAATGGVRADFRTGRMTGVVLQAIMFNAFSSTIGGVTMKPDDGAAEELWTLLYGGLGAGTS